MCGRKTTEEKHGINHKSLQAAKAPNAKCITRYMPAERQKKASSQKKQQARTEEGSGSPYSQREISKHTLTAVAPCPTRERVLHARRLLFCVTNICTPAGYMSICQLCKIQQQREDHARQRHQPKRLRQSPTT
mmetsp:Transcript_3046/g.5761  ORF Transcript_3046/g.5761 Transcript_3046/m.5761 type:complete len:133 (+) Transcript_3046:7-405(+)